MLKNDWEKIIFQGEERESKFDAQEQNYTKTEEVKTKSINRFSTSNIENKNTKSIAQTGELSHIWEKQWDRYQCDCDFRCGNANIFRNHVICQHQGQCLKNSSHFITYLGQFLKIQDPQYSSNNVSLISKMIQNKKESINEKEKLKQKRKYTKKYSNNKNTNILPNKSLNFNKKQQPKVYYHRRFGKKYHIIVNDLCNAKDLPFYSFLCGNCSKIFEQRVDFFIMHCVNVCKVTCNPYSSHFIFQLIQQQTQKQDKAKRLQNRLQVEKQKQDMNNEIIQERTINRNENVNESFRFHSNRSINESRNISNNYDNALKDAFAAKQNQFICGCGNTFVLVKQYRKHILAKHYSILPQGSSHIIAELKNKKQFNEITYYPILIKTYTKNQNKQFYFCHCGKTKHARINSYIQHIISIHKGIEPMKFKK